MNNVETIKAVIQTLRALFKEKDHLTGVDDWDSFIGCLIELERVMTELSAGKTNTDAKEE